MVILSHHILYGKNSGCLTTIYAESFFILITKIYFFKNYEPALKILPLGITYILVSYAALFSTFDSHQISYQWNFPYQVICQYG